MNKEIKEELLKAFITLCVGMMIMAVVFMITLPESPMHYAYVAAFMVSTILSFIGVIIGLKKGYDWI